MKRILKEIVDIVIPLFYILMAFSQIVIGCYVLGAMPEQTKFTEICLGLGVFGLGFFFMYQGMNYFGLFDKKKEEIKK